MEKKRCYNSGKIGGLPYPQVMENFRRADDAIRSMGLIPVSPLRNGLKHSRPWLLHMAADLLMLATCRSAYFQSNWQNSRGARTEFRVARTLRMEIWIENEE